MYHPLPGRWLADGELDAPNPVFPDRMAEYYADATPAGDDMYTEEVQAASTYFPRRCVNGVWESTDPNAHAGDSNLYAYVNNSPTDAVDPSGLWRITRNAEATATAVADKDDDTIKSLAKLIGLNAKEKNEWLHWASPKDNPRPIGEIGIDEIFKKGAKVLIPNTIVAIYAFNAWRDLGQYAAGGIAAGFNSSTAFLRKIGYKVDVIDVRPIWHNGEVTPYPFEIIGTISGLSARGELQGLWYQGHGVTEGMYLRHPNYACWSDPVVLKWSTVSMHLKYRLGFVVANCCSGEEGSKKLLAAQNYGQVFRAFEGWVSTALFYTAKGIFGDVPGYQGTSPP